ncbi:hypothetical protein L2728_11270 [Shewanella chilikensis]|uniref:DUF6950 family protein n=1 Tax=Shewanella TaxID=22 RepID=UPI000F4238C6|nr:MULTISPECIES: hypothetical protein [Shewanella]AYV14321.1 hypothetical protein EEY24_16375 [Shewanella algae]MCL1162453.1 hypothetical protein [Shewanella chilikensis]
MTLAEFVSQHRATPFLWGKHDCCLLAANWLKANGRGDLAASFRGTYSSELGAMRAIRRAGFDSLSELLISLLGQPTPPLSLTRGAVVLLDTPMGDVVGIYQGSDCFALATEGLVSYPKINITMGWNV